MGMRTAGLPLAEMIDVKISPGIQHDNKGQDIDRVMKKTVIGEPMFTTIADDRNERDMDQIRIKGASPGFSDHWK